MKQLFLTIIFLLLPVSAWSAAITTAQTGNYQAGASWVGGIAPGVGDSFTIALNHTITVTENVTTGDGTTTNIVNGNLIINDGVTFVSNGSLRFVNGTSNGSLTIGAGCTLDMSGGAYNFEVARNVGGTSSLSFNGTSVDRTSIVGGTGNWLYSQATAGVTTTINNCNITGFTGATGNSVVGHLGLSINNNLFKSTAGWIFGSLSMASTTPYSVTNNDFRLISPAVSNRLVYFQHADSVSTNTRTISGNTFVGDGTNYTSQSIGWRGIQGFELNDNIFYDVYSLPVSQFHSNIWDRTAVWAGSTSSNWAAKVSFYNGRGNTIFRNGVLASTVNNWHGINNANVVENSIMSYITDSIFYANWVTPNSPSNLILSANSNSVTISGNIFVGAFDAILPGDAAVSVDVIINNNTFAMFNPSGGTSATKFNAVLTEFNGRTGGAVEFYSNIIYNNGDNADNKGFAAYAVDDPDIDITFGDYNLWNNMAASYRYINVSGSYGANDVAIDPQFTDSSRDILSYTIGNGGDSIVDFFDEAVKRNGFDKNGDAATPNTVFTVENILLYMRAGFTPENTDLAILGRNGTYIGAVEPSAPADDYHPAAFLMGY